MKAIIPSGLASLLRLFLPEDARLSADQSVSEPPTRAQRLASVGKTTIGIVLVVLFLAIIAAEILACGAGAYYVVTEILTVSSRPAQVALSLIISTPFTLLAIGMNWAVLNRCVDKPSIIPGVLCALGFAGYGLDYLIVSLLN